MAAGIEVPKRVIALVVLALGFAVSCARLLGEVEIPPDIETTTPPNQPGGPPPKPVICELGTTNCDGRLLQLCTDGGTAWVTWQACATPALCKSDLSSVAACIPPTCALEQMSCSGAELRLCNEDRTGWTVFDTCETAAHCDAGKRQCLPAPCDPGDRRCNVGELQRCRDDQLDWEKLDACATNEVCEATLTGQQPGLTNGGLMGNETLPPVVPLASNEEGPTECVSPACLNQEVRCDGSRLLACNEGLTGFDVAEECATPVLCDASIAYSGIRGSPRCKRPACDVGKHHCSDTGVLEICNEDRTDFKAIEECIGAPFCSAVAADNDQPGCRDAPCESGEEQCNGADIQRCSADRTRFDTVTTCETRGLCDDDDPKARCNLPVCQRGPLSGTEFRCEGAVLQRCNDQHTGYDTLNTCATPGLCNAGLGFNGCQIPTCAPGQTRCTGDFLQVCNSQRNGFDNLERCSGGTCDSAAGRCSDPCVVGTARCNSQGQLEECRDRLVGRQITALCSSPQLCDAAARSCKQPPPGCTADGVRQCLRQGANTLLQVCTEGRSRFATVDTCTGGEVCDVNNAAPNQNVCDACAQNSAPTCQGNELVSCSADGLTPSRVTCPNGCQVVDNGPDRCRNCVPGSATCDGTGLLVCVSGGASNEFRERRACTTAAACATTLAACNARGTGENCSCAPGICTAGQRDCVGNQPRKCSDDLTAFVNDGSSCGTRVCFPRPGTTDRPAGTCGCTPGEDVKCVGGILQTCTPTGVFQNDPRFIPGGVLCLPGPNGTGQRALGCNGNNLRDDTCSFGCSVEKGCAECDSTFRPVCDGPSSRTVCSGGELLEAQPCVGAASNACVEAVCEGGACNPNAPLDDGTACVNAGTGGECENGSCAACGDRVINGDEQCDTTEARSCPNGQTGSIRCVGCRDVRECCGDGVVSGSEVCDTTAARDCSNGQIGSIRCVGCREVSDCATPVCGDGTCTATAGESTSTCPGDCGDRCGDGVATGTEACDRNDLKGAACGAGQAGSVSCSATCTLVRSCQPIICTPNAPRCDGDSFRLCNAAGTAEPVQQTCGGGSECVNPTTCNVTAGGCIGGGNRSGPCTGGLCNSTGQCVPVCTPNAVRCDNNNTLFRCNPEGTQESSQACGGGGGACVSGTTCSAVGAGSCAPGAPLTGPCQQNGQNGTCQGGSCVVVQPCGNGQLDVGEQCDGNLGVGTCGDGQSGTVTCTADCTRNTNNCQAISLCGNNQVDPSEECDGTAGLGAGCGAGQSGTLTCTACALNRSGCHQTTCADITCPGALLCNPGTLACEAPQPPVPVPVPAAGGGEGQGNSGNGGGDDQGGGNGDDANQQ